MATNVLITGGAGFIGYHTANKLVENGCHVRVLDNLSKQIHPDPEESLSRLNPSVKFMCGDVRNRSQLMAALENIEFVYHFAAETGVGQSMYEIARYSDVTIQGTAVLCDCIALRKGHVKKVILSSSRAVYGEGQYLCKNCGIVKPIPRKRIQLVAGEWNIFCPQCNAEIIPLGCQETSSRRPTSIYGLTKKVQEDLLSIVSATYRIPLVILRYFNVFGPRQSISNPYTGVLSIFSSLLLHNKEIEIYEDGQMVRDFVSIEEVVTANLKVLEKDVSEVLLLNIGSGKQRTILQLANYLKDEIGSKSKINITGRYRIGDIRHSYADVSKQTEYIGTVPGKDFQVSIRNLIDWAEREGKCIDLDQSIAELSDFGLSGTAKDSSYSK
ncbi:SDR family NAD(P)-dependent oxidoreductase [Planctomycetota bacterium]